MAARGNPSRSASVARPKIRIADITRHSQDEALKDLEARYHDLYENAPDMYLSTDSATGRVIRCNQTYLNATGYTRNEIIGRPVTEIYQPESQPIARQAFKDFLSSGRLQNLEMTLRRKNGSALPILLNASAVRDAQGRILHSRSILRDITTRKQVEEALRKSEERFRALTNFSPDIISIFDGEGRLVFNSAAAAKIHGYQPADLEGRSTFDFIHPDDRLRVAEAFGHLIKKPHRTVEVQYRYRNADGFYKWMEAFGTNELANPHINGIIAISRDITARKQTEVELRETTERLSLAQQAGHVGVFDWNLKTNEAVWTPELEKIFGLPSGGFEKRYEGWRKRVYPEDLPRLETMFDRWLKSNRNKAQWEYRYLRHGELRWISARGQVFRDGRGKQLRMLGTNVDITDLKRAEAAAHQLNETLEQRVAERTDKLNQTNLALQKSEEKFRAIAAYTPDLIFIQDAKLRYRLAINPQLGLTEADMLGKTDGDLLKPADAKRLTSIKKKVLATGKPFHLETSLPNSKGKPESFEGDFIPRRNAAGQVDGLIGYFRNVTKRKLTEETIKESEAKFSVAFKYSPTPMNISRIDDGRIVDANDAFLATTGYTRKEVIHSNIKKLGIWVEPKIRARAVRQLNAQRKVTGIEFQFRRKNGAFGTGIFSAHLIHLKNVPHRRSAF